MIFYVRTINGDDITGDGLSRDTAFKTVDQAFIAGADTGDQIRVSEAGEAGNPVDWEVEGVEIIQDPDGDPAVLHGAGAALNPASWTAEGTPGVYVYPAPPGLGAGKMAAVLWNYFSQLTSRLSRFGTLKRLASAAAVLAAASGLAGCFHYDDATGDTTAYFGGDNPAGGVTHYVARDNVSVIKLTGDNNRVIGISFEAHHNDAQGACIWLEGVTTSGLIQGCTSKDCGPHAFIIYGGVTATSGGRIVGCFSKGAKHDAAHLTNYQTEASGTLDNCTFEYCDVERHNWLNTDESDAGAATCAQNGFYTHADMGEPILGSHTIGCTSYDPGVVNGPIVAAANTPAPSDLDNPATFAASATGCIFRQMTRWIGGTYAFDLCILRFDRAGASGLCHNDGLGTFGDNTASARVCVRACEVYFNFSGDGAATTAGIIMSGANQVYRFINSSICMVKPDASGWSMMIQIVNATAVATFTGCILSYTGVNGNNQQFFCYATTGSTANFVALDNLWGITEQYGGGPGFSFAAPANEDAAAQTVATNPFTEHASSLRIGPDSSAWGKRRTTGTLVPSMLLAFGGGATRYDASHGAYAQTATTAHRVHPRVLDLIRAHNAQVARRAG
jgi:hypothetical protein